MTDHDEVMYLLDSESLRVVQKTSDSNSRSIVCVLFDLGQVVSSLSSCFLLCRTGAVGLGGL